MATLKTLVSFTGSDGQSPYSQLIADAGGDLFGTTAYGAAGYGTVFEIARTASGYAAMPATLVAFGLANGATPLAGLIADANGDLFGTTENGGVNGDGTVFEVARTATGYAAAPIVLASFAGGASGGSPNAGLVADANGDLFGTTFTGAGSQGTVFELARTPSGYAAPAILLSFDTVDGAAPHATLIVDANGDLFGTTESGGAGGDGTVFELVRTATGFASAPTTLAAFAGANGADPDGELIADANGDLFGIASDGGGAGDGTIFEIARTASGFATTPTTLLSFGGANGAHPSGALLADAIGDLFGVTNAGGASNVGTVFELARTAGGYATTPTTLVTFTGSNGDFPNFGLLADAKGDLFGATSLGGAGNGGTVFELTGAGYAVPPATDTNGDGHSDILLQNADGSVADWLMSGSTISAAGILANPGPSWHVAAAGDVNGDGKADAILENDNGSVAVWELGGAAITGAGVVANLDPTWHVQATGDFNADGRADILLQSDNGSVVVWEMNGAAIAAGVTVANPGPSWHAVATGDFNGDGASDIVLQNDDGTVAIWEMNGAAIAAGVVVASPGANWHVAGTGDFNGDGMSDILLQANDGTVAVWQMNGASIMSAGTADPGPSWHAVATGDYDGDGKSDILLQNDSGAAVIWQMNGPVVAGAAAVANPGAAWQALGLGSMHFIDATQSSGTVAATVLSDDFEFGTFVPGAHTITGFDPLHDAITLDQGRFPSFAAVQGHETQAGGSTVIDLGNGSTLTVAGVAPASLGAKNFV